jgi:hypothetical protein
MYYSVQSLVEILLQANCRIFAGYSDSFLCVINRCLKMNTKEIRDEKECIKLHYFNLKRKEHLQTRMFGGTGYRSSAERAADDYCLFLLKCSDDRALVRAAVWFYCSVLGCRRLRQGRQYVHRSTGYRIFSLHKYIKVPSGTHMRTRCGNVHHFHNIIHGLWAVPFSKKC